MQTIKVGFLVEKHAPVIRMGSWRTDMKLWEIRASGEFTCLSCKSHSDQ